MKKVFAQRCLALVPALFFSFSAFATQDNNADNADIPFPKYQVISQGEEMIRALDYISERAYFFANKELKFKNRELAAKLGAFGDELVRYLEIIKTQIVMPTVNGAHKKTISNNMRRIHRIDLERLLRSYESIHGAYEELRHSINDILDLQDELIDRVENYADSMPGNGVAIWECAVTKQSKTNPKVYRARDVSRNHAAAKAMKLCENDKKAKCKLRTCNVIR